MVIETKVNVGGTFRNVIQPEVNVSGLGWRDCVSIESYVSGVGWKTVWAPSGVTPFVSNIYVEHTTDAAIARAGVKFHESTVSDDGRIISKINGLGNFTDMGDDDDSPPVDHTGEWTSETIVESEWEVACISENTNTWDNFYAAVGVYSTLDNQDMQWYMTRPGAKNYIPGTDRCIATFRIREVADTANYTDFDIEAVAIQT